jgi:hypothetical protein
LSLFYYLNLVLQLQQQQQQQQQQQEEDFNGHANFPHPGGQLDPAKHQSYGGS